MLEIWRAHIYDFLEKAYNDSNIGPKIGSKFGELNSMVVEIKINYNKCLGCIECIKACSYGVLGLLDDKPVVVNPKECKACSECRLKCPVDAINIVEK
jgi:ferredoxin